MVVGVQGLSDLTQYVEQLAKVVERPYFRSSQYTFLFLEEGGLKDLPGVAINVSEEIWLEIERAKTEPASGTFRSYKALDHAVFRPH